MKKRIIQLVCLVLVLAVAFAAVPVSLKVNAAVAPKAMLAAGANHTIALKSDGTVWTWGRNDFGQLGINSTLSHKSLPTQVTGFLGSAQSIACGYSHSVILRIDGTVWTWGRNDFAQLGDGTHVAKPFPIRVPDLSNIKAVTAGTFHTTILKSDGTVWSWGWNNHGQLGDGSSISRDYPVKAQNLTDVKAIAASSYFTAALKNDGTVWTWGQNELGQLGDGTTVNKFSPTQVKVNGVPLNNIQAIAAGGAHMFAVKNDGTVWAWGGNAYGQLGIGTTTDSLFPVQIPSLSNVQEIASGGHAIALENNGMILTWGSSGFGQLGFGTIGALDAYEPSPKQVTALSNLQAITAGGLHSAAIKQDGTVWGWGYNEYGQVGNGETTPIRDSVPKKVKDSTGTGDFNVYGIAPTSVTLNYDTGSVLIGKSLTLTAMVLPTNATHKAVTWTSSNESIASVSDDGKVTAKAPGIAIITGKTINGLTDTCTVTAVEILPTSIILTPAEKTLSVGESFSIMAKLLPGTATNRRVTWSSSKTSVASVDSSGKVTAHSKGTATITAETVNGKKDTCVVTVNEVQPTSVTLNSTAKDLIVGKSFTITPTVSPSNTTNKTVTWSSSKTSVASVSSAGKVTAKAPGTATITAKTVNGKTATCKVTVHQYVSLRIGYTKAIQNGVETTIDNAGTKPILIDGRTMLPLRFVGEKMGATVNYVNSSTPITVIYGAKTVKITLGGKKMTVTENGVTKTISLDVPAQMKGGKTYIPLRAIGEALGFDVYYDSNTKIIIVNNPLMTSAIKTARLNEAKDYIK